MQQRSACHSTQALSSVFHFRFTLLHSTVLHLTYHDCCIHKGSWKQGKILVDINNLLLVRLCLFPARPPAQFVLIDVIVLVTCFFYIANLVMVGITLSIIMASSTLLSPTLPLFGVDCCLLVHIIVELVRVDFVVGGIVRLPSLSSSTSLPSL